MPGCFVSLVRVASSPVQVGQMPSEEDPGEGVFTWAAHSAEPGACGAGPGVMVAPASRGPVHGDKVHPWAGLLSLEQASCQLLLGPT